MSVEVQRRVFTGQEYHRMLEAGILLEDDRVELIEGEIVEMSPIGSRHAGCVNRLTDLFTRKSDGGVIVSVQNPIRLDESSEPQPDLALLKPRRDFYSESLPGPGDVLLVVEVSDTSVEYDRLVKIPLYAGAGVPEVWIIYVVAESIESHSQPVNGAYQKVRTAKRGEAISPEEIPNLLLNVDDILG